MFVQVLFLLAVAPSHLEVEPQTRASMDFWIGEWEVFTMDGEKAGTNRIERVLDGAALIENWTDAEGGEGKSWFYWMADVKKWKQVWVTPDGSYKEKTAEPIEGGLLFTGISHSANGRSLPDRTRLTRNGDGEVRQEIEVSRDGGKTWIKGWEAIYKRKKG